MLQDKARDFDLRIEIVEYIPGRSGYVIGGYQFRGLRSCNFSCKSKALFTLVNFRDLGAVLRCTVRERGFGSCSSRHDTNDLDNLITIYTKIGLNAFLESYLELIPLMKPTEYGVFTLLNVLSFGVFTLLNVLSLSILCKLKS